MVDADRIVEKLKDLRRQGADRDELLRVAVEEMEDEVDRYDWVGVYLLDGDELVLHSYVGAPTEHDRIEVGVGVCGTAVAEERDINVPDVNAVDNYLACSTETKSELVVLIRHPASGRIVGQIDIDSHREGAFDEADRKELRVIADWLGGHF
jgi:GAF domain-containing protein